MSQLTVTFLWHMHQPYYRDPWLAQASMPWVRMHACKAYTDMSAMLEKHPIKAVINMVPSLLLQLHEYDEGKRDLYLEVADKPTEDLTEDDRIFILDNFFAANPDTMIKPYPRYRLLFDKRRHGGWPPGKEIVWNWSDVEIRDLIVWFHLAWMGYTAKKEFPFLNELMQKGFNFTEIDKDWVLILGLELLKKVVERLKRLVAEGRVELTTTPFFHPILPLLIDTDIANRCMPGARLPSPAFSRPEDALNQILAGRAYFKKVFGVEAVGVWPSEGSVAPEVVPLLEKAGYKWFATDEDILMETLKTGNRFENIYHPWIVEHAGSKVAALFRDRALADRVGFDYPKMNEKDAAWDLIDRLKGIRHGTRAWADRSIALIALDGENAWEYYPESGERFLDIVYEQLEKDPDFTTATPAEFLEANPPRKTITELHSGSWIRHDYSVWIGGHEENVAWSKLRETREWLEHKLISNPPLSLKGVNGLDFLVGLIENIRVAYAMREMYAAEGSDWFWWFGDEYTSDKDDEFDRIFRTHCANVYRFMGERPPESLEEAIVRPHEVKPDQEPIGFVNPIIDGRVTDYYEWNDAGRFTVRAVGSTMYTREVYLERIWWGFNENYLYIRLDRRESAWKDDSPEDCKECAPLPEFVNIDLRSNEQALTIEIPANPRINLPITIFKDNDEKGMLVSPPAFATADKVMEIMIPFKLLNLVPDQKAKFSVILKGEGREMDRYPKIGYLTFTVPTKDFERIMWSA